MDNYTNKVHPLPGAWVAVVEAGQELLTDMVLHLSDCKDCTTLYKFLVEGRRTSSHKSFSTTETVCPSAAEDVAALIFTMRRSDVDEETKVALFKHLNQCNDCFQQLVSNWSAYINTCDLIAGNGSDEN